MLSSVTLTRKVSIVTLFAIIISMFMSVSLAFANVNALGTTVGSGGSSVEQTKKIKVPHNDMNAMGALASHYSTNSDRLKLEIKTDSPLYQEMQEGNLLVIEASGSEVTFNMDQFNQATEKSRKKALSNFIEDLKASSVSSQTQQKVVDDMSSYSKDVSKLLIPIVMDSTSADLYRAMKWLAPFIPIIRLIFGIGAFLISVFLVGTTILDLVFLGLPIARDKMQGEGGGKVTWVTSEARSALKESESGIDSSGGYKNAYLIYFKRRALTYILLSFCLLYLVVGELGGLIGWILTLGSGIFD